MDNKNVIDFCRELNNLCQKHNIYLDRDQGYIKFDTLEDKKILYRPNFHYSILEIIYFAEKE